MEKKINEIEILRHSTAHIMAQAVKELFPDVKLAIGPAIPDGFYYDFDLKAPFTPQNLNAIEEKMNEIIKGDLPFKKEEISREEAMALFEGLGEKYKVEIISEIIDDMVTIYKQGNFVDLCKGPHVSSTGKVKHFKLLSVAGAYWRGDEGREMLQRIYGTSFPTEEELQEFLKRLDEAEKRDHRKIGSELDLFSIQEEAGAGLVYWHPNGATIRKVIEDFWCKEHIKRGYQLVYIPHIAKINLWNTSGHTEFYRESMYFLQRDGQEYVLKPMNCPGHILIYKSKIRSYKDLPVRFAELASVYRFERSGVLHGLMRVRGFTQDDAHIFCTPEQLKSEINDAFTLADFMMNNFGFNEYKVYLSTRPEDFAGTKKEWKQAEEVLSEVLKEKGIEFEVDEGGAVFYGPKIDIKIKDALGRLWQGPTIQFDFNLPRRFNVTYVGRDGKEHPVIMVHRAVLGSIERFIGVLIEHYGGALPVWLSPVQVAILPIADRHIECSVNVKNILEENSIRVYVDDRNEKTGFKIREAQIKKIPYMIIVGDKEVNESKISLRKRNSQETVFINTEKFLSKILDNVKIRSVDI